MSVASGSAGITARGAVCSLGPAGRPPTLIGTVETDPGSGSDRPAFGASTGAGAGRALAAPEALTPGEAFPAGPRAVLTPDLSPASARPRGPPGETGAGPVFGLGGRFLAAGTGGGPCGVAGRFLVDVFGEAGRFGAGRWVSDLGTSPLPGTYARGPLGNGCSDAAGRSASSSGAAAPGVPVAEVKTSSSQSSSTSNGTSRAGLRGPATGGAAVGAIDGRGRFLVPAERRWRYSGARAASSISAKVGPSSASVTGSSEPQAWQRLSPGSLNAEHSSHSIFTLRLPTQVEAGSGPRRSAAEGCPPHRRVCRCEPSRARGSVDHCADGCRDGGR